MITLNCQCICGHTEFEVVGKPKLRVFCHCTICQNYNAASHADIVVFKASQVSVPDESVVQFETYKKPPNVQRGQCIKCKQAAIEIFNMPLFPKLTMVPAKMFSDTTELPEPSAHMFYEKCIADVDDGLPKYNGFMPSQLAFFKYLWFG